MGWESWIRDGREVEPSLYAADFTRLGEQIDALLAAGCRVFHFDVGDGHFVPPVTIGPVVLRSIAPMIHAAGGVIDCHLMVSDPAHHFPSSPSPAPTRSPSTSRRRTTPPASAACRARPRARGRALPSTPPPSRPGRPPFADAAGADMILCMSIEPGYSGQAFMPEAFARIAELARLVDMPIQVDGGVGEANAEAVRDAGRACSSPATRCSPTRIPAPRTRGSAPPRHEPRPRARPRRTPRGPVALSEPDRRRRRRRRRRDRGRGRHRAVRGRARRGRGARRGRRPSPRRDALRDDGAVRPSRAHAARASTRSSPPGVARVVAGCLDPNPEAAGGLERLRAAGVEVELDDRFEARRQNEAWRTWKALGARS